MSNDAHLEIDLDDLPLDVFELVDRGAEIKVESLTGGHGMGEMGASTSCSGVCISTSCQD
jgi:hypothetical protein